MVIAFNDCFFVQVSITGRISASRKVFSIVNLPHFCVRPKGPHTNNDIFIIVQDMFVFVRLLTFFEYIVQLSEPIIKWDGGVRIWRYFRKKNRYRLLLCSLSYYAWTDMNRDSAVFFEPDNYLSICSKCKHEEAHLATVPLSKEAWLKRVFFF